MKLFNDEMDFTFESDDTLNPLFPDTNLDVDSIFGDEEDDDDDDDEDEGELTSADESYIFLDALRNECTPEEFEAIAVESAMELELYGLIDNADSAMEARRNIVKLNKIATLSSVQKRTAIRIGARKNDPSYKLYKKHRDAMIKARKKLFEKYASQSKSEAKKIMTNSKHKAASMPSVKGATIVAKMDTAIKKVERSSKKK